ncbi:MAG TPA: DUF167 domain-containing protein [Syntrophorhabdaceae bacterium]|nr:DUF167 domain-containing protein [Syntrophorhabdaceae bacterium]
MRALPECSTITVRVITNAKKREIVRTGTDLKVKLTSLPIEGRANEELIELLADYFHIRKSEIQIIRGEKDKRKVVALPLDASALKNLSDKGE